ncbi:MAG: hypothetical protein ACRBCL_08985 [Maritimibacter sp.]
MSALVKAANIKGIETLEAWLEDQPREVAQQIAARAALRVMPIWAAFCQSERNKDRDLTPLITLRPILISSVAGKMPTDDIKAAALAALAANAAANAADAADAAAADAADAAAADAADAANAAATYAATYAAAAYAAYAAYAANAATVWQAIRTDAERIEAGESAHSLPLWPEENPLQKKWDVVRNHPDWSVPNAPNDFWRRWYQSLLDGKRVFPDQLLYDIAILPNDLWKGKGAPQKIAGEIKRLEEEYQAAGGATIETALARSSAVENAPVMEQQLRTLLTYLQQQKRRLVGLNSLPESQLERKKNLVSLFDDMIARVDAMLREFEDGIASENALVVVQEQVPAILEDTAKVEDAGGAEETAAYIAHFATTSKVLAESGVEGKVASGLTAFETFIAKPYRDWRKNRKNKKAD